MKELENVGFHPKEAAIYTFLAKRGDLSAAQIAKKLSFERRTTYDFLERLYVKGYVGRKKVNGVETYNAVKAEHIAEDIHQNYLNLLKVIPQLHPSKQESFSVNVLFGVKAVKQLVDNALKANSEVRLLGRGGLLIEQLGESKHQFVSKLSNIKWKMIQTRQYTDSNFKPSKIRFFDTEFETAFATFTDKVYLFSKQDDIVIIEITDKAFAKTFSRYFELLWSIAQQNR